MPSKKLLGSHWPQRPTGTGVSMPIGLLQDKALYDPEKHIPSPMCPPTRNPPPISLEVPCTTLFPAENAPTGIGKKSELYDFLEGSVILISCTPLIDSFGE